MDISYIKISEEAHSGDPCPTGDGGELRLSSH